MAVTIEAIGAAFTLMMTPVRAIAAFIGEVAAALTGLQSGGQVIQALTDQWFKNMQMVQNVAQTVQATGQVIGQYVGALINQVTGWFSGLWTSITEGVQGVYGAITGVFAQAFNAVSGMIQNFWNSLPDWLKGALSAAGEVAGGVYNAVAGALNKVGGDIQKAKGALSSQGSGGGAPQAFNAVVPTGGGLTGGGGGGGGASKVAAENTELQKKIQLLDQIKLRTQQETLSMQQKLANTRLEMQLLQQMGTEEVARKMEQVRMEQELNAAAEQRLEKIRESGAPIEEIRVAEEAVKTELEKQLELVEQLVTAQGQLKDATDAKYTAEQGATGRAGKGGGAGGQMGKEILGTLKGGLGNVISTAIKGGDVKAAFQQMLGQIADKLINMALDQLFAPLEAALAGPAEQVVKGGTEMAKAGSDVVAGASEQVSAAAEGAASAALGQTTSAQMTTAASQQMSAATQMVTAAAQQMAAAQMMATSGGFGFFADGGRPTVGEYSVVGEKGPELVKFDQPATVFSNDESKSMVKAMGTYSPANNAAIGGMDGDEEGGSGYGTSSGSNTVVNYNGPTLKFNSEDYVPMSAVSGIIDEAAAKGAKQGQARTMNGLKNSRSQRKKIGM